MSITEIFTPKDFIMIADKILNNSELVVGETRFRICEIEFYYRNEEHNDEYVHSHKNQLEFGKFYFHRYHNGSYKSGTYKGMDLAFGDVSKKLYCGILIRSIQDLKTGDFIEGPCRSVNKILETLGFPDVKTFMQSRNEPVQIYSPGPIQLVHIPLQKEEIYCGPRVGLSDKYPNFKTVDYRFATQIKKIKKQKKFKKIL